MRLVLRKAVVVGIAPLALVLALLVGCMQNANQNGACISGGSSASGARGIRNGQTPTACDFQAVVRLDITGNGGVQAVCTGTIIANGIVLSAAHCFVDPQLSPVQSVIIRGVGGIAARVLAYRTYNGYNANNLDSPDMSILYLDRSVQVTPIPIADTVTSPGDQVIALGYGRDARGSDGDGQLGQLE